jgi:hypothetical protein
LVKIENEEDLIKLKKSPRSSQSDSGTLKSDNSSLLVNRILNANKRFRYQEIDDTDNYADINLSCEL